MASSSAPVLVAALVGVGAILALASASQPKTEGSATPKAKAGTTPPESSTSSAPPPNVLDRIMRVLATTDPAQMRLEATKLDAEGWTLQADDLRRAADVSALGKAIGLSKPILAGDLDLSKIKVRIPRARQVQNATLHPFGVPDEPIAESPLPGYIEAAVSPATADAARIEAQELVNYLERTPPAPGVKSERVYAFQAANELKPSGYYGSAVALKLATHYGLVPPRPMNWPSKGRAKAKRNYRDAMHAIAARDPQRAEEFIRAGKV